VVVSGDVDEVLTERTPGSCDYKSLVEHSLRHVTCSAVQWSQVKKNTV
jgi:hypothetical protein